jgi:thioredoxin 1
MNSLKLAFAATALVIGLSTALAANRIAYETKGFDAVLETGKPVLVHVTAPWCGECRIQKPIVAALADRREYSDLTVVDVDFDTQKDALRRLGVQKQSTLVVFKGKAEMARSVGITRRDAIEALIQKGF